MSDELSKLYLKIKEEINYRTIKKISGKFSIYNKQLILIINDIEHDISEKVPKDNWRKGTNGNDMLLNNPIVNYEIRVALSKIANDYVKSFDPNFEGSVVL